MDPYHLAQVDGQWYLAGHCLQRGVVQMFAPGRIRGLEVTDETFTPPAGSRIEAYLAGSPGVLLGEEGEVHRVRLRFTGAVCARADLAPEPGGRGAIRWGPFPTPERSHLRGVLGPVGLRIRPAFARETISKT